MRSILEELFYGNVRPSDNCKNHSEQVKQLMGYIADHHDRLFKTLSGEQKEMLEKFDDCSSELTCINERELFAYAFRLGAQITMEMLKPFDQS